MNRDEIRPASDEQVATLKAARATNIGKTVSDLVAGATYDILLARIESDRAQIKRCHAIIQGLLSITDPTGPDAGPINDADRELAAAAADMVPRHLRSIGYDANGSPVE